LVAVTIVASFVADQRSGPPLGAGWGMRTLGGEWWRLLTSIFVHHWLYHILPNVALLWFFGKRLERIIGRWPFLAFYLTCGVAGGIVTLAANPEVQSYGASGAVFGLAGGLVGVYGLKVKALSRRQRCKFALLVLLTGRGIYAGFSDPVIDYHTQIDNYGHIGGLLAGLVLGAALTSGMVRTTRRRLWVFAGMAAVLLLGAISIRQHDCYVVHLDSASRALEKGRNDEAATELHIALRMKPKSELAHYFVREWEYSGGFKNACSLLSANAPRCDFGSSVCKDLECDGQVHTMTAPDGTRISYQGTLEISTPPQVDGALQTTTIATVTSQALDEFGEIACTIARSTMTKQELDANGAAKGKARMISSTEGTMSEFDPKALSMRDQVLRAQH